MNNDLINSLRNQVKSALIEDGARYLHTIGVADTCACLAMKYGEDIEKAYISGLLHDCAKCVPDNIKIQECIDNDLTVSDIEMKSPHLLHSKLGALYARTKYNINDNEICSSIEWHTTGKPGMTTLEKIVFVSDYIEPLRNKAKNLEIIRGTAFDNLDKAVYIILKDTLEYLEKKGNPIDSNTFEAYNYYKKGDNHA